MSPPILKLISLIHFRAVDFPIMCFWAPGRRAFQYPSGFYIPDGSDLAAMNDPERRATFLQRELAARTEEAMKVTALVNSAQTTEDWVGRARESSDDEDEAKAPGGAQAEAEADAKAEATGGAHAEAEGDAKAEATGGAQAEAEGDPKAEATGGAQAEADAEADVAAGAIGYAQAEVERGAWFVYLTGARDDQLNLPREWVLQCHEALEESIGKHDLSRVLNEDWFLNLQQWPIFAVQAVDWLDAPPSAEREDILQLLGEQLLFTIQHLVAEQLQTQMLDVSGTDRAAIRHLESLGWQYGRGQVWGANNCFLDSLLQLLVQAGHLAAMAPDERRQACRDCRAALLLSPALHPRDGEGRLDPTAYLQHHMHGAAAAAHFMEKCTVLRPLPDTGLVLRIHARLPHLGDVIRLGGPAPHPVEGPGPLMNMYCLSGRGLQGFHYDPLVPPPAVDLEAAMGCFMEAPYHPPPPARQIHNPASFDQVSGKSLRLWTIFRRRFLHKRASPTKLLRG